MFDACLVVEMRSPKLWRAIQSCYHQLWLPRENCRNSFRPNCNQQKPWFMRENICSSCEYFDDASGLSETCRPRQRLPSWAACSCHLFCAYMKNIYNTAQKQSFRRWVSQLFTGWAKRQHRNYLEEIFEMLQDIKDSIDIIAREIARQAKQGE